MAGRPVVLSCNAASLTAHDPASGKILLDCPWRNDKCPKASQPVVLEGDRVFLSAGYGPGCMLLEVKAGADEKLAATPLWKNIHLKNQFNSVAVRNGFLCGMDDGLLACVEIATGQRKWKEGSYGYGQSLLVEDLALIQSEPGDIVLALSVVTAGCKTVIGARCKQSRMFWSKGGAENILALRRLHSSRRLDEFWKHRLNQHARRNDALRLSA